MEAAFWRAERVTLAGSMMPAFTMSAHSMAASKPMPFFSFFARSDDDRAVHAGVLGDLAQGLLEGALDDLEADLLVVARTWTGRPSRAPGRLDEGDAAAGDDAFLDGGAGCREGVLDAVLLLLHLDLGGRADVDHGHAAGELGQALLELLLVVVGGGVLDLGLDLRDAVLDVLLLAGALDDGGVFLVHLDLLGACRAR